jgi:hypothetical protein
MLGVNDQRHIRSYQGVSSEIVIHTISRKRNVSLWFPVPMRGLAWFAGLVPVAFVLGLVPPYGNLTWWMRLLIVPGCVAALFTAAKPEGRRLHVFARQAVRRSHYLVGAYRVVELRSWRAPRVKPLRTVRLARILAASSPIIVLVVAVVLVLSAGATSATRRVVRAGPVVAASLTPPVLPAHLPALRAASRVVRHAPAVRHRHAGVRPRRVVRHRTQPRTRYVAPARAVAPVRTVAPVVAQMTPTVTVAPPVQAPPVVTPSAPVQAPPVQSVPVAPARPSSPSCYPGQPGC